MLRYPFYVIAFATYYIARIVTDESLSGPFGALDAGRGLLVRWEVGENGRLAAVGAFLGEVVGCIYCAAPYAGAMALLLTVLVPPVAVVLAAAGVAIFLKELTNG